MSLRGYCWGIGHKFPRAVALGTRDPASRFGAAPNIAPAFDSPTRIGKSRHESLSLLGSFNFRTDSKSLSVRDPGSASVAKPPDPRYARVACARFDSPHLHPRHKKRKLPQREFSQVVGGDGGNRTPVRVGCARASTRAVLTFNLGRRGRGQTRPSLPYPLILAT